MLAPTLPWTLRLDAAILFAVRRASPPESPPLPSPSPPHFALFLFSLSVSRFLPPSISLLLVLSHSPTLFSSPPLEGPIPSRLSLNLHSHEDRHDSPDQQRGRRLEQRLVAEDMALPLGHPQQIRQHQRRQQGRQELHCTLTLPVSIFVFGIPLRLSVLTVVPFLVRPSTASPDGVANVACLRCRSASPPQQLTI